MTRTRAVLPIERSPADVVPVSGYPEREGPERERRAQATAHRLRRAPPTPTPNPPEDPA